MIFFLLIISIILSEVDKQGYLIDENNFIINEPSPISINYKKGENNSSSSILDKYHFNLLHQFYKNKKEFFVQLKSGDKYKVSEVIELEEGNVKVNILTGNIMNNTFTSNNISKHSDFYYSEKLNPKYLLTISIEDIIFLETISYEEDLKNIRDYTLLIFSFILMLDTFF